MLKINKLVACGFIVMGIVAAPIDANASLIEAITDSLSGSKEGSGVKLNNETRRAGSHSFEHTVTNGKRAELAFKKTEIGKTYWKGWAVYIPKDFDTKDRYTIIGQWAAYPSKRDGKFPCGAVGHRMDIRGNGDIKVRLQPKELDQECVEFKLGNAKDYRGKWIDFAEHAKWDEKGFFRLWMRVTGEKEFKQVVDFSGHTWWKDEGDGPYWKMGVYLGGEKNGTQRLITDEYRLGDDKSNLTEVVPY